MTWTACSVRTIPTLPPARRTRNAQVTRILASGVANGDVPAADRTYLAQLVPRAPAFHRLMPKSGWMK